MASGPKPFSFRQWTSEGGPVIQSHLEQECVCHLEYDTEDGYTHLIELLIDANETKKLPWAKEYRVVHRQTKQTLDRFLPWQFNLVTCTRDKEFIVKYIMGPVRTDVVVEFYPGVPKGIVADYEASVECDQIDEWVPGRSYALHPQLGSKCTMGKFVMRTSDGQYESMIPWVQPTLKNPSYALSQIVTPLTVQTLLAVLVHGVKKQMGDQAGEESAKEGVGSAILNTLITSLMGMHGPMLVQEMGRGVSPAASQVLPRPGDANLTQGWKRLAKNPEVWKRMLASVVGTQIVGHSLLGPRQ